MNNAARYLIICILATLLSASMVAADYLGSLREATLGIEVGAYTQAGVAIEQALVINEADPLVHLALGTLFLNVGKLDDSSAEFREVSTLEPGNWQAHYGLALIALLKGDRSLAQKETSAALNLSGNAPDVVALDQYRAYIETGKAVESEIDSPLAREITAVAAAGAGQRQRAKDLLIGLLSMPSEPGYEERRTPVATFARSTPISIPQGALNWSPPRKDNVPEVSDVVYLKADASKADGVAFVSFYVDGTFVGMSNWEPYSFNWSTTRYPNGLHQIRIDGKDSQGNVVSSKSMWVRVRNANGTASPRASGPEADDLAQRLWKCMRLSECRRLAHYELARIYQAEGDSSGAIEQCEYAVAYRPDFAEALKLLDKLRGRQAECREIWSGPARRKRVAITFDDGPNPRTAGLLEMLGRLNAPATFFLVGFRAESQPELVKAIQDAGHDIESHSYTHPNLAHLSEYGIGEQLCKTNAIIRRITGKTPTYFRPPGGNFSSKVKKTAAKYGMNSIFWTLNCGPYEGGDSQVLADYVTKNIRDGAILLMHNGEPATVNALPLIVEKLRNEGYEFVTITDLLSTK